MSKGLGLSCNDLFLVFWVLNFKFVDLILFAVGVPIEWRDKVRGCTFLLKLWVLGTN